MSDGSKLYQPPDQDENDKFERHRESNIKRLCEPERYKLCKTGGDKSRNIIQF